MIASPPPQAGPFVHWVHDGEARVHRLMTRERFSYLHDLLASTSMQGEDSLWADLDDRTAHWQGQSWREDERWSKRLLAKPAVSTSAIQ
ncbi:hypothetical protein SAMN06296065_12219 [Novosphingobium panipatense]|uniref:Uncharacterized protein n=1 Tax=Novosphingobium panipatense TaxID=428991 RepID=A0ABY1QW90_9SPHN|nr:hypothetical protein SAMN06296065_12219 [Novosphingobium panipatense]